MSLRAVVTGASAGIGRSIALAIGGMGASLGLVGRDQARLEEVAGVARDRAAAVLACRADLTLDKDVLNLVQAVEGEFGGLDVLVHSAGLYASGSFDRTPVEQMDLLYRANVRSVFLLTQMFLPALRLSRGQIVFINSSQGRRASANAGAFAATQHALKALTDSLRQEVNGDGIRVLSIFPGRTATPRMEAIFEDEARPYRPDVLLQPDDIAQTVLSAIALPQTAEIMNIEIRPAIKSY